MPTTPVALLLFVALLTPGFAFVLARERGVPERPVSVFRETATVAVASIAFNSLALALFAVLRAVKPRRTPDVGEIIRAPGKQFRAEYDQIALWALGLLLLSTALAYVVPSTLDWWRRRRSRRGSRGSLKSAWHILAEQKPDQRLFATCILDDGSYVAGYVLTYNWGPEENADRDIGLRGPTIDYRAPGETEIVKWPVGGALISARNIKLLTFSYLPSRSSSPTSPTSPTSPAPVRAGSGSLVAEIEQRHAGRVAVARGVAPEPLLFAGGLTDTVSGIDPVSVIRCPWPAALAAAWERDRMVAFRIVQEFGDGDATTADALKAFGNHPPVKDYIDRVRQWLRGPVGQQTGPELTSQELEQLFGPPEPPASA